MQFIQAERVVEHIFRGIADVIFLVLMVYAIRLVRHSKWRIHLDWLLPGTAGTVIGLIYRTIVNGYFFSGQRIPLGPYLFDEILGYASTFLDMYSTVILCRTLKGMVNGEVGPMPMVDSGSTGDPGAWPPPAQPPA